MRKGLWRHNTTNFPWSNSACSLQFSEWVSAFCQSNAWKNRQLVNFVYEPSGLCTCSCFWLPNVCISQSADKQKMLIQWHIKRRLTIYFMFERSDVWLAYTSMPPTAVARGIMFLCCPFVLFWWTFRNALREFLPILHKCPHGLKDELIRLCDLNVMISPWFKKSYANLMFTQMSNRIKSLVASLKLQFVWFFCAAVF